MQKTNALTITTFRGVNAAEHSAPSFADGQARTLHNFRVTEHGALRRREGYRAVCTLPDDTCGFCYGRLEASAAPCLFYCTADRLCAYDFSYGRHFTLCTLTRSAPAAPVTMFLYRRALYFMGGGEYFVYRDGVCESVEGYEPLRYTDVTPYNGAGKEYEAANGLTRHARATYSPAETSTIFLLPERASAVRYVRVYGREVAYRLSSGLHDPNRLQVTLEEAVEADVNSVEIGYVLQGEGRRAQILENTRVYRYGGADDLRLFFYGNPQGRVDYSVSLSESVHAAEYVPQEGHFTVGTGSGAVTGILRRYNHLIVHTASETFAVTRAGDRYDVYLVNDRVGHTAAMEVAPMEQDSCAVCESGVYRLKTTSVVGDRRAQRVSGALGNLLSGNLLRDCVGIHHEREHEIWLGTRAGLFVYRYDADVWYTFDNPHADGFLDMDGVGFYRGRTFYRYEAGCDTDGEEPFTAVLQSAPFVYASTRTPIYEVSATVYGENVYDRVRCVLRTADAEVGADPSFAMTPHRAEEILFFDARQTGAPPTPTRRRCYLCAGRYASVRLETQSDVTVSYLSLRAQGQSRGE